jgi:hypothetical protein
VSLELMNQYADINNITLPAFDMFMSNETHWILQIFSSAFGIQNLTAIPIYDLFSIAVNHLVFTQAAPPHVYQNPLFVTHLLESIQHFPEMDRSRIHHYRGRQRSIIIKDLMLSFKIHDFNFDVVTKFGDTYTALKFFPFINRTFPVGNHFHTLIDHFRGVDITPKALGKEMIYAFYPKIYKPNLQEKFPILRRLNSIYPNRVLEWMLYQNNHSCSFLNYTERVYVFDCVNQTGPFEMERVRLLSYFLRVALPSWHGNTSFLDECLYNNSADFLYRLTVSNESHRIHKREVDLDFSYEEEILPFILNETARIPDGFNTSLIVDDMESYFIRKKRSHVSRELGNFFNWCCDLITEETLLDLKGYKDEVQNYFEKIKNAINSEHSSLVDIETDVRNLNGNFTKSIQDVQNDLIKAYQSTLANSEHILNITNILKEHGHLFDVFTVHFNQMAESQVMQLCYQKLLSTSFIDPLQLKYEVIQLWQRLFTINRDFTLLFDEQQIMAYYKHPLLTCHRDGDSILLQLNVPLRSVRHDWELMQIHSLPQLSPDVKNKICRYNLPNYILVDMRSREIRAAEPFSGNDCTSSDSRVLCFVNQFPAAFLPNIQCLNHLYFHPIMENIVEHCPTTCVTETKPIIYQISGSDFSITNFDEIILHCPAQSKPAIATRLVDLNTVHKLNGAASLRLQIPCNCVVKTMSLETLIHSTFPCQSNLTDIEVKQIVPSLFLNTTTHSYLSDSAELNVIHNEGVMKMLKATAREITTVQLQSDVNHINKTLTLLELETKPKLFNFHITNLPAILSSLSFFNSLAILFIAYWIWCKMSSPQYHQRYFWSGFNNAARHHPVVEHPNIVRTNRITKAETPKFAIKASELQNIIRNEAAHNSSAPPYYEESPKVDNIDLSLQKAVRRIR